MTIAYKDAGAVAAGTTSLSIPHPTVGGTILAGELLIVAICSKYPTYGPADISGWTKLTSDSSGLAPGTDTGNTRATIFYKVAAGGESGNLSVTLTGCGSCVGRMFRFTKNLVSWLIEYAIASKNALTDPWTGGNAVTAASNPGLTAGDNLLVVVAINGNVRTMTLQAVTAAGVTAWGTMVERQDDGTNNGDDCALMVSEHPVTTGTATEAPVFAADLTTAGAGGVLFFRMREYTESKSGTAAVSGNGSLIGEVKKGGIGSVLASIAGAVVAIGVAGMLAAASIFGGGSPNVTAQKAVSAGATISGGGSVIATGQMGGGEEYFGTAILSGNGSVLSEGRKNAGESLTVSGNGPAISEGNKSTSSITSLSANGSVNSEGIKNASQSIFITSNGLITVAPAAGKDGKETTSVSGGGSLVNTGLKDGKEIVVISENGTLEGIGLKAGLGAGVIQGNGEVNSVGTKEAKETNFISGAGLIGALAQKEALGLSSLSGNGELIVSGTREEAYSSIVSIFGNGSISSISTKSTGGISLVSANGEITTLVTKEGQTTSLLSGGGSLEVISHKSAIDSASISENGFLFVSGIREEIEVHFGIALISGNGSLIVIGTTETLKYGSVIVSANGVIICEGKKELNPEEIISERRTSWDNGDDFEDFPYDRPLTTKHDRPLGKKQG